MTVFDRLEAQLLDAHPNRARRRLPRPAPRRLVAFATAAAAVAVVAVAALSAGSSTAPSQPAAQPGDLVPPVAPGKTTVAVLNGTGTPGAAGRVASALADRGWKIGTVANYADRNLDSSCVDFVPGRSAAASLIATQLGIHNVLPATRLMTALAGPKAGVVVIVGRDRAH
jgi:hypothetical protein